MIGARLAELRAAVMLLTRLPAGRLAAFPPLSATVWAFPLVGLIPGGVGGAVLALGLTLGWPPALAATLALAVAALITGALHEDGLADCADALGGRDRAARLAILKDSRIGSFGALALILSVALRVQGYGALGQAGPLAFVLLAVASRAPMAALLAVLPAARADGLGAGAARPGAARVTVALALGTLAALAAGGPALVLAMLLAALAVALAARRALGGQTGDVLGASQQIAEIAALLTLLATR